MSENKGRRASEIAIAFERALALHQQGQLAQAEALYRAIITQVPNHFDALHFLGLIDYQRQDYESAVRLIGQALKINPKSADAYSNMGSAVQALKHHGEAIACYDRALAIKPDCANASCNRGNGLFELKRYGEAIATLMSLPLAFKTTLETIPAGVPYLEAAPDLVASWQARLGARTAPRIGLAWSGNPEHKNDRNRSIALGRLARLIDRGAVPASLQLDMRPEDAQWLGEHNAIRHFGSGLRDFADTAALTSLMDLVISVDTSAAHLAGALGKPVWILLPFIGVDWRWLLHRADSPWYPTARLFRQPAIDDWDSVIARVADAIATAPARASSGII